MLVGALVVQVRGDLGAEMGIRGPGAHENPALVHMEPGTQEGTSEQALHQTRGLSTAQVHTPETQARVCEGATAGWGLGPMSMFQHCRSNP